MRFNDLKRDELVEAANHYKVEIDHDATKAEISTALLDAGKTPEQWETDQELWGKGDEEVQAKPSSALTLKSLREAEYETTEREPEPEPEEPKQQEPEPDDDIVLVRFVGKNRSYRSGKHKFDATRPFGLVTRDEFEALAATNKFREATKAEANEFYG